MRSNLLLNQTPSTQPYILRTLSPIAPPMPLANRCAGHGLPSARAPLSSTSTSWTPRNFVSDHHAATVPTRAHTSTDFPIFLTTWHLIFATFMTQFLARFTTILDSRKKVPMTGRVYLRAIVPIGLFFSLSLICGNQAYLYLSVAFIQMLKVRDDENGT